jgi:Flp pilus assembly protein TadG
MRWAASSWVRDRHGVAALEFALIVPVLLLLLGGVSDFGLLMWGKSELANGIAQGVQYALLTGPSVSAAAVKSAVQNGATRSGVNATVTVNVTGPACYCVSGQPAVLPSSSTALSSTYTCTGTCPTSGNAPGAYMIITVHYMYQPLMPLYSQLSNPTVAETVTVRLL